MKFKLKSSYKPTGDQPQAIEKLVRGLKDKKEHQVLLGVTGSGKTFTMANIIEATQRPTLIISHNKTLAAQLYQEFRDFFPENAVSYFVSYYDYYQPEAYIPQSDTYIEKETDINEELDRLRLAATTNLLTRKDVIVVASVSCIYNLGSPTEYGRAILELSQKVPISRETVVERLTQLQYERSDFGFHRGTFRVRGDTIDIFPAYEETAVRVVFGPKHIEKIEKIHPLTGKVLASKGDALRGKSTVIYPAKHYIADLSNQTEIFGEIRNDLVTRLKELKKDGKELEAHRLSQRVNYDLEMIEQVGYVNGIENYSRYFDGRSPGQAPYSLLDFFNEPHKKDPFDKRGSAASRLRAGWLMIIDESHMTIPQIRGMYNGDRARKEVLINYGFRLPAAFDNRPLRFEEFLERMPQTLYTSATPNEWEIEKSRKNIVEQLIRPTGLVDPEVIIRPTKGQVDDLIGEIKKRVEKGERVLVTTLTKRMAEDLAAYLKEQDISELDLPGGKIKVHYLHSEVQTLDRVDILEDLRRGNYDVIVGINLLREGLDLPEVSLVAILDADNEGFLRSDTTLIQTMGRAARNVGGQVIMYADKITGSMDRAIKEVGRRREIQRKYNEEHKITPKSIEKPIREKLIEREEKREWMDTELAPILFEFGAPDVDYLTPMDRKRVIKRLEKEMREAAAMLEFEAAAQIRDKIREVQAI
ncbi:excinuclease ABC subunit UvrB [Candidatus Microgenomates bacterium]|nr:excinuclease ABC subunit UvrB [Candidatus Microgenomates bacterium]